MQLATAFHSLVDLWRPGFRQGRMHRRIVGLTVGLLCTVGRRTVLRVINSTRDEDASFSADYLALSRSEWDAKDLFNPILNEATTHAKGDVVVVGIDDTLLRKTGLKIPDTSWNRDPLGPKFRTNIVWGIRYLTAAILLPLHAVEGSARAIPIKFEQLRSSKKPKKNASEDEKKQFREHRASFSVSSVALASIGEIRTALDATSAKLKTLLVVGDGSFCNRTLFRAILDRTELMCRARKDAKLCKRASGQSRRFFSKETFTPEQVLKDPKVKWREVRLFYGSGPIVVRYKEINNVFWRTGAARKPLRLLVVAPIPYQPRTQGNRNLRQPGYLLTTSLSLDPQTLLQSYLDRWQIEVTHRDLKTNLGAAHPQVRNPRSVERAPALIAASYSALILAALRAFGPGDHSIYEAGRTSRKPRSRPSIQDLITLLRCEISNSDELQRTFGIQTSFERLILKAAA